MEHDSLEFRTAEPSSPRILSPELEYDVSVIGIFLGALLGVALLLNNLARGAGARSAFAVAAATISAAARGIAPTLKAAAQRGPTPETPPTSSSSSLSLTTTTTTSPDATFVFRSTERP